MVFLRSFVITIKFSLCLCSSPRIAFRSRLPLHLNFSRRRKGIFIVGPSEESVPSIYLISKALSSERTSSSARITSVDLELGSLVPGVETIGGLVACACSGGASWIVASYPVGIWYMSEFRRKYVWRTSSVWCRAREIVRRD